MERGVTVHDSWFQTPLFKGVRYGNGVSDTPNTMRQGGTRALLEFTFALGACR
jgi:hypothetical protein